MKNLYLIYVLVILVTVGLNTISHKFLKQRWNLWLGYGLPALGMIWFIATISEPPLFLLGDFGKAYYPSGSVILQNPSKLYKVVTYFVNIPIIALLFTPFSLLKMRAARVLFTILGILAVFTTYYLLLKLTRISGWKRIVLFGLFIINGPLYNSLKEGNLTHFVLLLLLAALFCLRNKREIWLGVLLAIAALIKVPLFLLGVYFFLRGRWQVVVGFSTVLVAIVGTSLLLFGFELHQEWLTIYRIYSDKPLASFNIQSVSGFLARLLTNLSLHDWVPTIEVGWDFKLMEYALISLIVGMTIWICWRSKPPTTLAEENLEFSIVLCLGLLISPISWTHYYLFLLLPFALYLGNQLAIPKGQLWSSLMVVSIILTSLPVIFHLPANPAVRFLYSKLLISHYFFGGLLLLGVLLAARWHTAKRLMLSPG